MNRILGAARRELRGGRGPRGPHAERRGPPLLGPRDHDVGGRIRRDHSHGTSSSTSSSWARPSGRSPVLSTAAPVVAAERISRRRGRPREHPRQVLGLLIVPPAHHVVRGVPHRWSAEPAALYVWSARKLADLERELKATGTLTPATREWLCSRLRDSSRPYHGRVRAADRRAHDERDDLACLTCRPHGVRHPRLQAGGANLPRVRGALPSHGWSATVLRDEVRGTYSEAAHASGSAQTDRWRRIVASVKWGGPGGGVAGVPTGWFCRS